MVTKFLSKILICFLIIQIPLHSSINQNILQECLICGDEKSDLEFIALECGDDEFCTDCLNAMIQMAIKEQNPDLLICPNMECKQPLTQRDIRNISGIEADNAMAKIKTEKMAGLKHCPTPGCLQIFFIDDTDEPFEIQCKKCAKKYCSQCLLPHNIKNVSCAQAKATLNPIDSASRKFMAKNKIKPCPKCSQPVERISGCDYVKCKGCKHEFCINCYGSHHVYNCTNPKVNPYADEEQIQHQPINADEYFAKQAAQEAQAKNIRNDDMQRRQNRIRKIAKQQREEQELRAKQIKAPLEAAKLQQLAKNIEPNALPQKPRVNLEFIRRRKQEAREQEENRELLKQRLNVAILNGSIDEIQRILQLLNETYL